MTKSQLFKLIKKNNTFYLRFYYSNTLFKFYEGNVQYDEDEDEERYVYIECDPYIYMPKLKAKNNNLTGLYLDLFDTNLVKITDREGKNIFWESENSSP